MPKDRPPLYVDPALSTVDPGEGTPRNDVPPPSHALNDAYVMLPPPGSPLSTPNSKNALHSSHSGYRPSFPPLSPSSPSNLKAQGFTNGSSTRGYASPSSSGAQLSGQPSFRRHYRQRSSTIYVAPRHAAPVTPTGTNPVPNGLVRGVTTLAGAQVLAKLLAFLLNQVLVRFLGARELGAASQLELLVSTALVLSRDAIRLASQRQTVASVARASGYTTDARAVLGTLVGTYQETSNLGWLSLLLGTGIVSMISSVLYLKNAWQTSVIVVASLASLIELLAEPGFLVLQLKIQLAERARAESLANTVRVLVVGVSLLFLHVGPFLGFALGHLGYALALALAIHRVTRHEAMQDGFSMLPTKVWDSPEQKRLVYISEKARNASLELGVQQIVKFVLTEGDRLAVSVMTSLEEQGEYALAANYGSLLARMVFSPVDEALRSYFSRESNNIVSKEKTGSNHSNDENTDEKPGGDSPNDAAQNVASLETSATVLSSTLRAYSYLGIFAAGFGPLASTFIINILVKSSKFGAAAQVLSAYAYYIPVMAWNGTLESLVQSTAPLDTLRWQGTVMAALAVLFVILTYVFVTVCKLGGAGIVWAQVCTMLVRIAWSLHYSKAYFQQQKSWLANSLPNKYVSIASVMSVVVARFIMPQGAQSLKSFILLAAIALLPAAAIALCERKLIKDLYSKLSASNKAKVE